ncbi:ATP-dependent nuclease [Hydrogenophaga sp. RWCD_12]|uniref:ATP-dependent nuclease n=1 Tax=Hydrogenophaga sp. RWCD_12 TaxID=3391190 RepID=UPI003984D058
MIITLRNIKKIKKLEFHMPAPGVWVLTGLNGTGKTSLFASLYRIGAQHAFQKFYKTSPNENRLDSYDNAEIEYKIDGESAKYHYGGQRWRATPRRNAALLDQSPYASVEYVEASGKRIEPYPDEIQPRRLRAAEKNVRDFLSAVLADQKWDSLKYVNTRRGVGNDAYLIPYQNDGRNFYFSEKSFSLGELCTLKLAKTICTVPDNSLLLIDEVEMALHPQAQVRLLKKVVELAEQKGLTVLFSTHSATLIKNANRKSIIHLLSDSSGEVSTVIGAFPAQVLGDIAFDDELAADFVFYVEDKQAKLLVEQMVGMYMAKCHPNASHRPLYKIAPVGGFVQVVEMLNTSSSIFPNHVRRYALLDEDVKTESLVQARRQQNTALLSLFATAADRVKFLPCTPELGVIQMLEQSVAENAELLMRLNQMFAGQVINIANLTTSNDYLLLTKTNIRDRAKDRLSNVVDKVVALTGLDEIHVRRTMYYEYCKFKYGDNAGGLRQLLGPVFNVH